ncbi:HD domain-containing protein [Dorea sp. D27]|uniref:HD domain-containing protein n=1 Tax=Dorea sp. D27 TaxID=658665 RepID=UPI0006730F13|nr:HD domain-containing protein [Dorea sp. D27]KMZ53665.1 HD domain protein [Dorea sp. D27]
MDNELLMRMTEYYAGQPHRIQHFMKVYAYSRMIGEMEQLDSRTLRSLTAAAAVHDIGIKKSEEVYGDIAGKHQEELGPDEAAKLLAKIGYDRELIERVCYLVGHHHTYTGMDGMDYQILVESDFLVNLFENEDGINERAVRNALERIFVTESGKALATAMFLAE